MPPTPDVSDIPGAPRAPVLARAKRSMANGILGAALIGGLLLVAAGTAMVELEAGLIVAGVMLTAGALIFERGRQP